MKSEEKFIFLASKNVSEYNHAPDLDLNTTLSNIVIANLNKTVSRFILEIILDFGATNINCVLGNLPLNKIRTEIQLSNIPKLGEQIKSLLFNY